MNLDEIQKTVYDNKVAKGFNVTDVNMEFNLLYGEVAEAYEAWRKKKDDLGQELADIAIFLLGLSEILGFSLEEQIAKKVAINSGREYQMINGVLYKKEEGFLENMTMTPDANINTN